MECEKFCTEYGKLLDKTLAKVRKFTLKDFAIYELCIASFASIFTLMFYKNAKKAAPVLGLLAGASYAYLIHKLFFKGDELNESETTQK